MVENVEAVDMVMLIGIVNVLEDVVTAPLALHAFGDEVDAGGGGGSSAADDDDDDDDEPGSKMPAASVVAAAGAWSWAAVGPAAPADPKLADAVVEAPLATWTWSTTTTSPSTLVTRTATAAVPKPLSCWKKLYDCRVVPVHVAPPSVLTSRLETARLALTTCMLNQ